MRRFLLALTILAAATCGARLDAAAFDAFIKIDGIPGESKDETHRDEIEILSFSWGATNSGGSSTGGGGGAGKVSLQDFHFVARTSIASPKLFLATATGTHLRKAVLTMRKSGGKADVEFYRVTLEDVLVSSYQTSGGDASPSDQVALTYGALTVEYRQSATAPWISAGWDARSNTPAFADR